MAITNGFDINKLTPLGQYFYQQNLKNSKNNINGNTISNFPIQNNSQSYDYGNNTIGSDSSAWGDMWNVKTPDNAYTQQPINANTITGNVSALSGKNNPIFNSKTMSNWYGGLDYDAMSNAGMSPEQIASFAKGYRSPLEKGLGAFAAGTSIAGGLYEMYLGNKQDKREENLANLTEKIANNELQRRTDFQNNYNKSM